MIELKVFGLVILTFAAVPSPDRGFPPELDVIIAVCGTFVFLLSFVA
jgi:hypothetical protein